MNLFRRAFLMLGHFLGLKIYGNLQKNIFMALAFDFTHTVCYTANKSKYLRWYFGGHLFLWKHLIAADVFRGSYSDMHGNFIRYFSNCA